MGRTHLFSKSLFQSSAPFSHIVLGPGIGCVSGIIGQRPDNGTLVSEDVAAQADRMFDNLEIALGEASLTLADLLATHVYLVDYADFEVINNVYRKRLAEPFPARTTLQVAGLPLGARVQIDATVDASNIV
ncbi:MAG TPA: RidA family protein [Vineibacter sp.]|nr:RidA family protein [Vineibacter sp.]